MWTEAEAKTKWCPEVRRRSVREIETARGDVAQVALTSLNIMPDGSRHNCIGSACMMWRWVSKPNPAYRPSLNGLMPPPAPSENPAYIQDRERGYCGKAGRP